jgi:hypothetical protein
MLCSVAVYPRKMPVVAWVSSFAGLLPVSQATIGEPKTRNFLRFGFFPVHASNGVMSIARWGNLFLRYVAWIIAHDQYSGPNEAVCSSEHIMSPSVRLGRSAIPFWKDASGAVDSRMYPEALTAC